ncbi:MAG TPA: hypothetical protein VGF77_09710 [Allosphingosinicella sp.]|jgi:hypothetical protein
MPKVRRFAAGSATALLLCFVQACSRDPTETGSSSSSAATVPVPAGFSPATMKVNGGDIYYLKGGAGPGLILLHGFPEDGYPIGLDRVRF